MNAQSDHSLKFSATVWIVVLVVAVLVSGLTLLVVDQRQRQQHNASGAKVIGEKFFATGNGNNGCGNGDGGSVGTGCSPAPGKKFTMTASVNAQIGLGFNRTLLVHVSNPNNQDMQVLTINPVVQPATGAGTDQNEPACTSSWVSVSSYSYQPGGAKYVALANKSVDVPLGVVLNDLATTNQDNCKGASFPITLTGTGQQV